MIVYFRLFLLLFLLFTQLQYVSAKGVFEVTTSERVYAIGHPIDLIFETRNINQSLSILDLKVLNKNFVVHDYNVDKFEDSSEGAFVRVENLVVRLYPKRAGSIVIPAFKLGRYNSNIINLNIVNDFNSAIQIRTTVTKKTYFQREPINIFVDVFYRQKKILSSVGELKNKNFIISDVIKTEYVIKDNGANLSVDRFSWIVTPLLEGQQTLALPMVKTGGRRMYPSGNLSINVTALPSTLPPLVPVSKQTILKSSVTNDKIWINTVHYWSLSILGNGMNENILDKILVSQLETNADIRYFPRSYTKTRINNGSQFQIDVEIPFKVYKTGDYALPIIDIPYIDSETGILEHSFSRQFTVSVTSHFNENVKVLFALMIFMLILAQPVIKLLRIAYIKNRYRMCYYAISLSNNPEKIKQLIFKLTPNFTAESTLSIRMWQETAKQVSPDEHEIINEISTILNKLNYNKDYTKQEIVELKKLFKRLI